MFSEYLCIFYYINMNIAKLESKAGIFLSGKRESEELER
jgi:hypothetical protein